MFRESVSSSAKRVGGLQHFEKCVLTTAMCVRRLLEIQRDCFDFRRACMKFLEDRRVGFDYRKACRRVVEVQ